MAGHGKPTKVVGHVLDTSVARPMILGTEAEKAYYAESIPRKERHILPFVCMEFTRSYIVPLVHFYFLLEMPEIRSIGDALKFWNNRFAASELKAVIQLMGDLCDSHQFSYDIQTDKVKAAQVLGRYILTINHKFRSIKNISVDRTRCPRALLHPDAAADDIAAELRKFETAFGDKDQCRAQCKVGTTLLDHYKPEVQAYIDAHLGLKKNRDNNGFMGVAESLAKIREKGERACTCRMCGRIGDALIALESPENMILDHVDKSFDLLCEIIGQPHHLQPSVVSLIKPALAEVPAD